MRPYQAECVDAVFAQWESGHRSTQVVMCTGGGKTVVFCEIARRCKGKVLIVVHREVLLQQTVEKMLAHTGDHVGIERASEHAFGEKFVVCTMQTAAKRLSRVGLRREFGAIIIDESHHGNDDPRYRQIVDYFEKARVVCFTATPKFSTRMLVPETLAYYMDIKRGTEEGWLVPLVGDRIEIESFSLRELRAWSEDFDEGEVPEWMVKRVAPLRDILFDRYPTRRGILFTQTVREAFILNEAINSCRSGSSVMMSHDTPPDLRAKRLAQLRKGRARFFCNVGIAVEGFDWPNADLVALGGETSWHTYVQKVGRVTRPLAGVVDGLRSAGERRSAIAKSAKPNGLVLEMFESGKPPDMLRMTGPKLEEAYKEGVAQLKQVMEVTCRIPDEESDSPLTSQRNMAQLQQAERTVLSIDSETIYNVASYDVQKRMVDTLFERETDGNDRMPARPALVEEIVPKMPRRAPPTRGWEKLPVTPNQRKVLECEGLSVPEGATKQWASWAIDILLRGKGELDPWKLEQINSIPLDGIRK
jgi:superfamily II DNA or RNA helicase